MGHYLNAFLGRPEVLAGMAPSIRGLRLVALPQGLAMAPLPSALGDAVTLDHGPIDGWREFEHGEGAPGLGEELRAIAAAASRLGPVGWLRSEWFGGVGDNTVALWRDGRPTPVELAEHMLAALGVERRLAHPDPDWTARLGQRLSGKEPTTLDRWDSLDLGDHRDTWRAWSSGVPVEPSGATPAQRAMLAELYARLDYLAISPPQDRTMQHLREPMTDAYLFETSFVPLRIAGRAVWAFTSRFGGGLGALLPRNPSDHDDYETGNLELEPDQESRLRAKGWRLRWSCWEAAWPDAEQAVEGLLAVEATLRP